MARKKAPATKVRARSGAKRRTKTAKKAMGKSRSPSRKGGSGTVVGTVGELYAHYLEFAERPPCPIFG